MRKAMRRLAGERQFLAVFIAPLPSERWLVRICQLNPGLGTGILVSAELTQQLIPAPSRSGERAQGTCGVPVSSTVQPISNVAGIGHTHAITASRISIAASAASSTMRLRVGAAVTTSAHRRVVGAGGAAQPGTTCSRSRLSALAAPRGFHRCAPRAARVSLRARMLPPRP